MLTDESEIRALSRASHDGKPDAGRIRRGQESRIRSEHGARPESRAWPCAPQRIEPTGLLPVPGLPVSESRVAGQEKCKDHAYNVQIYDLMIRVKIFLLEILSQCIQLNSRYTGKLGLFLFLNFENRGFSLSRISPTSDGLPLEQRRARRWAGPEKKDPALRAPGDHGGGSLCLAGRGRRLREVLR